MTEANDHLVLGLIRYFLYRDEQIHRLVEESHVMRIEEVGRATTILALNAMI